MMVAVIVGPGIQVEAGGFVWIRNGPPRGDDDHSEFARASALIATVTKHVAVPVGLRL